MHELTDLYKQEFIKAVILINKELYFYIHNNLNTKDISYSNITGYGGDNSLNIDLYAESLFIKKLSSFGNIYSEECGFLDNKSCFEIVIDPLDGSENFKAGLEYYGSSVALRYKNKILAGFICNLAVGSMIYRAFDGKVKEFYFNENKTLLKRENSKLALFERAYSYPNISTKLYEKKIKFRSPGAAALSLGNARNYDFVLFLGKIREFDILASLYINESLFIYKSHNFLIISKNKQKIDLIKEIINEELVINPR